MKKAILSKGYRVPLCTSFPMFLKGCLKIQFWLGSIIQSQWLIAMRGNVLEVAKWAVSLKLDKCVV